MPAAARWKLLTALWTVYLVWGSTYLAIKVSVRTLPAFLSAGSRFLLAGALLAAILAATGRSIVQRGDLEPLYLRDPHITTPKARPVK